MPEDEGRNEQAPGHPKEASATLYLVEELGDARLRCDQLVRYIAEAVRLIETSPHRDKFYETAGHLLHAAPLTLFKLQKALQAVALAANRIDYEELKVDLRPEKVEQLERVLEDVRIRQINRHSEPLMNPQQVAAKLHQIAATTRESQLPQDEVVGLIAVLERGEKKADESFPLADKLDKLAELLVTPHKEDEKPSRLRLASVLRRMVGDVHVKGHLAALAVAKGKQAIPPSISAGCGKEGCEKAGCDCDKAGRDKQAVPPGIASKAADWQAEVTARYEEGEDADKDDDGAPDNLSEEEAEKWRANVEKHKDKFKKDKKATEEKQTGFAEGEKADKDNDGVPDNIKDEKAKKDWKENTDKFEDKFKGKKAEDWKIAVKLPSEESGGKPGYDEDFKAGFAAGKKAYKADDQVSSIDGDKAYKRVSSKHGSWWKDGYSAAIDLARGAYGTSGAQIAKKMRLAASEDPWKVTAALKPKDKKVVEAFQAKKALEGSLVSTDGRKLIKNGMGGGTFAEWKGSKIVLDPDRPMVKNDEPIIRYMKKAIPKNDLADHPNLRAAASKAKLVRNPTKDQLMADLNTVADELFSARMAPRLLADHLKDAEEDFITGDGPFAGMDERFVNGEVATIRKKVPTLDLACGQVARDFEYIAKKLKQTKTARYEEGEDADKDDDGVPDNIKDEKAKEEWKAENAKHKDKFKKDANMLEGVGLDPERVEALNEAGRRNHEAIFGGSDWKA